MSVVTEAEQLARRATTREGLARVIELCQRVAAAQTDDISSADTESPDYAARLAAWAANRRGELAASNEDEEVALADFELAIRFDPDCWQAIHNRGVSHAVRGDRAEALADLNRAIKLNPQFAAAFRNRGELRSELGLTSAAISDYTRAIAIDSENSELYRIRGHAQHRLDQNVAAVRDLNTAIRIDPENAAAFTDRGNVYAELGYYYYAIKDYREAIRIDSRYAPAYRAAAWVLATCPEQRFRRPEKALVAARRAVILAQNVDPLDFDALAAAQASAGQFAAAAATQERAIKLASAQPIVRQLRHRLALYRQGKPFKSTPR